MEVHFPGYTDNHTGRARDRVVQDIKTLASDTRDLLGVAAVELGVKAAEGLRDPKAAFEEISDRTRATLARADDTIRLNPYKATAAAFGIGVLIGLLLRRRD